jgi:hypothetical protein
MSALTQDPTNPAVTESVNIDRLIRRMSFLKQKRPNDPEIKRLQAQIKKAQQQQQTAAAPPAPTQPTPESMSGDLYQQFAGQAQQFNPNTFQSQYEPQFEQEMERARKNIMGSFERRNAEEFAKQQQGVEQTILERGLDPAGEAAAAVRKQLTQRQDLARQEAMSAAEDAAYEIQRQGFEQAQNVALMPGSIWQQFKEPYLGRAEFQYQQQLQQQQFGYQKELQKMAERQRRWELRNQPRGGGGGGGGGAPQPGVFDRYMEQEFLNRYPQGGQLPQPDPLSEAGQAFLRGIAAGTGQQLARG